MTITFYTNFINHHQVPLADELYNTPGVEYTFVSTTPIPDSFKSSGYTDFSDKPYHLEAFACEDSFREAMELGLSSDIVIIGEAPDIFIKERLKENKHTFRYNERWFKRAFKLSYINPLFWLDLVKRHTIYRKNNFYVLCASAYTLKDVSKVFAYPQKCYKWGYFTKVDDINIEQVLINKRSKRIKFLWCARFLGWKHPELPLLLAKKLIDSGFDNFEINMLGSGREYERVVELCKRLDLSEYVNFLGNKPNQEVLELMQDHHIFLFTSDRNEGWGAVLNEAMSSGCTVVSSDAIGATPFLIDDEKNGMIFRSGSANSLYSCVRKLVDDEEFRERLALEGYRTMKNVWSPECAAKSFLHLASSKLNSEGCDIKIGPCSPATKISKKRS